MTDEEREKLVYRLRQTAIIRDIVGNEAAEAADEIERQAAQIEHLRNLLYDERILSSACAGAEVRLEEAEAEIKRLIKKNKRLREDAESWRRQNA